jgi:hypothetical protein
VLCIHQNTLKTAPQRVWLGVKKSLQLGLLIRGIK